MKILAKTSIWTWDGRIGRLSYFVNYWLFLSSLSMLLSSLIQLAFATIPTLQLALITVLNLVFLVIGCNGMFKRMHDYGVSAVPECLKWWGIPFVLLIAGALMLGLCGANPSTKIVGAGLVMLAFIKHHYFVQITLHVKETLQGFQTLYRFFTSTENNNGCRNAVRVRRLFG